MFEATLYGHCNAAEASWDGCCCVGWAAFETAGVAANEESIDFGSSFTEGNPGNPLADWNNGPFTKVAGEIWALRLAFNESADLGEPKDEAWGRVSDLISWV